MPYSLKYNTLFIHIPKTGGSSVEKYLEIVTDHDYGVNLNSILKTDEDFHSTLQQAFHAHSSVINDKTVLIATIRDPYSRIVSHYSGRNGNWYKKNGLTLSSAGFLFFLLFELPIARIACFVSLYFSKKLATMIYHQYNHLFSQSYYLNGLDCYSQYFRKVVICNVSDLPAKLGYPYPSKIPYVRKSTANTKKLYNNKFAMLITKCHYFNDFKLYKKFKNQP